MTTKERTTLSLHPETLRRVERMAKAEKRSISNMVSVLLDKVMDSLTEKKGGKDNE